MEKLWIVEERKDKRMYRRRCAGTDVLTFFFVSSCALLFLLVCSILYGTRTESHTLPPLVREVMPAGRCLCEFSTNFACDTCLDCAANQVVLGQNASEEADNWLYNYKRDRNNYGLDEAQCDSAFPGQYEDIERAVKVRKRWGKVTEADLSSFDLTKGMVRAMVYDREVSRCLGALQLARMLTMYSSTFSRPSSSTTSTARKRSPRSVPCTAPSSPPPPTRTSPT
jgi:hypothetical protein